MDISSGWDLVVLGSGPAGEADKIPGLDRAVDEGDVVMLGAHQAQVLNVGGHTLGHIAYHMDGHAFVGDSLFVLGCGRVFEGTMAQMWDSLQKLNKLPDGTQIYCAHEYSAANAAFAVTIDPNNQALHKRVAEITALRASDKPTVPTEIALERATNPFLRATDEVVQAHLNMAGAEPADVFAEIRQRKDNF